MRCKKCRKNIPDGSKFCNHCGNPTKEVSMYRRPDGLYEKTLTLNGKRKTFRAKSEKEVLQKIAAYDGEKEKGRLFKDVAEEWEEEHFPTLSPNTLKGYRPALSRGVDAFGEMYLPNITPQSIQQYLLRLAKQGYSRKTVTTHLLILNLIFKRAVIQQELSSNPAEYVTTPKGLPKSQRNPPTDEQIEIIKNSYTTHFGMLAFFVLYTGLRKGEALALTWGDIDAKSKTIAVTKSLYFESNQPKIKQPKTQSGIRTVMLPDILSEKLAFGKENEPVFPGANGHMTESEYMRGWEQYCKTAGMATFLPYTTKEGRTYNRIIPMVTLHQLRHAYASTLHEAGIDVKDAQSLLGHSTIAMTQDVYTHVSKKQREKVIRKINDYTQNTQ